VTDEGEKEEILTNLKTQLTETKAKLSQELLRVETDLYS